MNAALYFLCLVLLLPMAAMATLGLLVDSLANFGLWEVFKTLASPLYDPLGKGIWVVLLLLGGWALAGPSGVLAWSENGQLLAQRHAELSQLSIRRDELRNRVDLLDPRRADPDLVGELLRSNLNVAHPDEIVIATP